MIKLVLLGPPGAGKGTMCMSIVEKYGLTHMSSGDILRAERAANSELGQKAQGYMDSGELVPDDVIIGMMIAAIEKAEGGYVLDGFPRTVLQGEELDKALDAIGAKIDAVVDLQVPDEVIEARMTGRRSCPACGAVYHILNLKPKVDGQCDKGCGELTQRTDDVPDVVANRLKIYHEQTAAVVGYYKGVGKKIIEINANQAVDDVKTDAIAELDKLNS
jgi:adenylate kinase